MSTDVLLTIPEARTLRRFKAGERLRPYDINEHPHVLLSLQRKGFLFDVTKREAGGLEGSPVLREYEITHDALVWLGKVPV